MADAAPLLEVRPGAHDLVVERVPDRSLRVDLEGRWCTFRRGPEFLRRTLDGEVVQREGSRAVPLDAAARDRVHEEVGAEAREIQALARGAPQRVRFHAEPASLEVLLERLERVGEWTAARFRIEGEAYHAVWPEDIRVLPPDRYHDLVLLPAFGCPHGRCVFCTLFSEPAFRVLAPAEFTAHLDRVARFLGSGAETRRGVFLGSASAVSLPQARMLAVLEEVRARFGERERGVAAFLDPDHAPRREAGEYAELREAGLRHVTMGLETGLPELREGLGKSGDLARFRDTTRAVRAAGLVAAVTVLVGAGGADARDAHERATRAVLRDLDLGARDLVYLSPLEGALPPAELEREVARWRDALRAEVAAKVVPYRMELYRHYS